MFIVGLIVGPVVGVLAGDYLFRPGGPGPWLSGLAVALVVAFLLFAPVFILELKTGLILGFLAGVLLSASPMRMDHEPGTV